MSRLALACCFFAAACDAALLRHALQRIRVGGRDEVVHALDALRNTACSLADQMSAAGKMRHQAYELWEANVDAEAASSGNWSTLGAIIDLSNSLITNCRFCEADKVLMEVLPAMRDVLKTTSPMLLHVGFAGIAMGASLILSSALRVHCTGYSCVMIAVV